MIEFASQVLARAEARQRAAQTAQDALAAEKIQRGRLREERENFAGDPRAARHARLGCLGRCARAHERARAQAGDRHPALRARQILTVFLSRAFVLGLLGGIAGWALGFCIGLASDREAGAGVLFDPLVLVVCVCAAPALSLIASWLPATLAARQQPATVLREE